MTYYYFIIFRFDHFFLFTSEDKVMKEGIMKVQDLPCCRKSVGDDFSVYLPTWMLIQKSEHWKIVS
jgi:hypothetical protein